MRSRTVQRWEKDLKLPVRRHQHKKQGSVYAYRSDYAWRRGAPGFRGTEKDERGRDPWFRRLAVLVATTTIAFWIGWPD